MLTFIWLAPCTLFFCNLSSPQPSAAIVLAAGGFTSGFASPHNRRCRRRPPCFVFRPSLVLIGLWRIIFNGVLPTADRWVMCATRSGALRNSTPSWTALCRAATRSCAPSSAFAPRARTRRSPRIWLHSWLCIWLFRAPAPCCLPSPRVRLLSSHFRSHSPVAQACLLWRGGCAVGAVEH